MSARLKSISRKTQADSAPEAALPPVQRLDQQLCFALYSAVNRMIRLYRPILDKLGITYPQYLTLLALWERSPRTVGDLGRALDLDSGTLTPLLKRLENQGLVVRHRDPADERRVIIELTEQGQGLRTRAAEIPAALSCKVAAPGDELGDLRERIWRLNGLMSAALSAPDPPSDGAPGKAK